MADVFLSYKREDREKVRSLVEALQARGWTVWWDTRIGAGEDWDQVIQDELAAAKCILVVWSKLSVESYWARLEASEGRDRKCLIPVTIEGVTQPKTFKLFQATDLTHWQGSADDANFEHVCAGVRRLVGHLAKQVPHAVAATASTPDPHAAELALHHARAEHAHWDMIKSSDDPEDFFEFLTRHPNGSYGILAHKRLTQFARATAHTYCDRGATHFKKNDYDSAIAEYTKAIAIDPKNAVAYVNRGVAYSSKDDYDRAIVDYAKAIEIDAKLDVAYGHRGYANYRKKKYGRAIADFTKTIEINRKNAVAYFNRGAAYEERKRAGDRDRAIADYRKALELRQSLVQAREGLTRLGAAP